MSEQYILFGIDDEGNLQWSKLTEAGIASTDYAPDDMWTGWAPVVSIPDIASLVCQELDRRCFVTT